MVGPLRVTAAGLILTAGPLAAQTDLGFRAGVGLARMDFSRIAFALCPPETDCHGVPDDWILSPLISADVRHATAVEELSFRLSLTYAVKGGAGSGGRYANGMPSSGTQRLHFLQFSPLLNVNVRPDTQDARGTPHTHEVMRKPGSRPATCLPRSTGGRSEFRDNLSAGSVMISGGKEVDSGGRHLVDQAMLAVDPTGPRAGKLSAEWLRFSEAIERIPER